VVLLFKILKVKFKLSLIIKDPLLYLPKLILKLLQFLKSYPSYIFKLFTALKQYSFCLQILILKYTNYYSYFIQFGFKILNLKYRVLLIKKEFLKKLLISIAIRLLAEKVIAYTLFFISKAISKGKI